MNERSNHQPELAPRSLQPFLRHESDRDLLAHASVLLDRVIAADNLEHRLSAWVQLIEWARSGPGAGELDNSGSLSQRAVRRWTLLLDFLDRHPQVRARFVAATAEILAEA